MILYGGVVVCVGGVDFVFEVAEVDSFAVADNSSTPEALVFSVPDAFVA